MHTHTVLNTGNIKEVLDLTWKYRAKWRFIGEELGIDTGTLDAIHANSETVEDSLVQLLDFWLKRDQEQLKPTRNAMLTALQSVQISPPSIDGKYMHFMHCSMHGFNCA